MNSGNDGFLGGMFDLNGDGKTDLGEAFIAYKIYEAVMSARQTNGIAFPAEKARELPVPESRGLCYNVRW